MKPFRSVININNIKTKEDIIALNNNNIKPIQLEEIKIPLETPLETPMVENQTKPSEITSKKLRLVIHSLHKRYI
jgi:hypothetical protein